MTKRDYENILDVLRAANKAGDTFYFAGYEDLVERFARHFASTEARFDKEKFFSYAYRP